MPPHGLIFGLVLMCADCEWEEFLAAIEDAQNDKRYEFAADTLSGIYSWVEENQHCTSGQRTAVSNIVGSK